MTETVNADYIKKLDKPQASTPPSLSRSPWWQKASATIPIHPICQMLPQQTFSPSNREVRGGWPLAALEQLQDELGRAMQTIAEDEMAITFVQ
jgi:hypothetical protein